MGDGGSCKLKPECAQEGTECDEHLQYYGGAEAYMRGQCKLCEVENGKCRVPLRGNPWRLVEGGDEKAINQMIMSRMLSAALGNELSEQSSAAAASGIVTCYDFCVVDGNACKLKPECAQEGTECDEYLQYYGGAEAYMHGQCKECEVEKGKCRVPLGGNPWCLVEGGDEKAVNQILLSRALAAVYGSDREQCRGGKASGAHACFSTL